METGVYHGRAENGVFGSWFMGHTVKLKQCCLLLQMQILYMQTRAVKRAELLNCFVTFLFH